MSAYELKAALKGIEGSEHLTVSYASNGNQILHVGDKEIEVGPMASNDEIRLALLNPFIKTENTKMSITGIRPGDVKGILQKVRDRQAGSLARVGELASKSEEVAQAMDGVTSAGIRELDDQLAELGQFSNLGPALDDLK
ncbi:hypothetical protein GWE18_00295 [Bradyrhizobium sp. CSA112]|uniref:hypothetical protein n=1 Tax=Bradyrhizobium sp. CSA112 TaxID=2699170 RepID=UPI0023AF7229|nr:hypothetical protein [Bradyrhizobium sp. CSA112]MDE5451316.1 hypothetical protein [Bradyrhizobium sp. CSA112]